LAAACASKKALLNLTLPRYLLSLRIGRRLATWLTMLACTMPAARAQSDQPSSAPLAAVTPSATAVGYARGHVDTMRRAHLIRLQEHIEKPEEALHHTCRFESDIATLPPEGVVALTFDDGPEPGHTEALLAVLASRQVPATFFLIAEKAKAHPELVEQMRTLPGVVIGNHSWSHPNFHDIAVDEQTREVDSADALLHGDLGTRPLFRYPYGNSSCETNERVHTMGYHIVGWHVDSCDWAFDGPEGVSASEALSCGVLPAYRRDFLGHIIANVRAHRGGVVLMHETQRISVNGLDALIVKLQAEGYRFSTPAAPEFASSLR
jgi:peptidoglycan/xylan/chitin deacetylase (PgdA/CDA1 family)